MTGDEDAEDWATEPLSALMERALSNPLPVSRRWNPSEHTKAALQIRHALQKLPGWKRIRKRNTARYVLADRAGNPIKKLGKWVHVQIGVKGDTDIDLLWRPPGAAGALVIAIEVKTGTGRLSEDQAWNRDDLIAGGCHFIVAGTAAEAFEACIALVRR